jgi:hypothetical protein
LCQRGDLAHCRGCRAADQTSQTSIFINGKVDDSIFKGLQKIDTETGKIVKQEKELGKESQKAFELMGKGMATATAKSVLSATFRSNPFLMKVGR